jgi:hypothetical protein
MGTAYRGYRGKHRLCLCPVVAGGLCPLDYVFFIRTGNIVLLFGRCQLRRVVYLDLPFAHVSSTDYVSLFQSVDVPCNAPKTHLFSQEFGIDIVGEDNKTVVHHKVAAKVACIFSESDAAAAARSEASGSIGSLPGNGFNFGGPGGTGPRRPGLAQQQGLGGMGGMGSLRPPGKSGLTFDHILSKLQGEIQKSRETGAELHGLTGTMGEIHDTLGGNLVSRLSSTPDILFATRHRTTLDVCGAGVFRETSD